MCKGLILLKYLFLKGCAARKEDNAGLENAHIQHPTEMSVFSKQEAFPVCFFNNFPGYRGGYRCELMVCYACLVVNDRAGKGGCRNVLQKGLYDSLLFLTMVKHRYTSASSYWLARTHTKSNLRKQYRRVKYI